MKNFTKNTLIAIGMMIGQVTQCSQNNRLKYIIITCCLISCSSYQNAILRQYLIYDRLSSLYVLTFTDKMPRYNGRDVSFLSEFNKNFHYNQGDGKDFQTKIKFQFVINKKGKLVGARVYNKEYKNLTNFERAGLEALTKVQSWSPGKFQNKKVNVLITQVIHIDVY